LEADFQTSAVTPIVLSSMTASPAIAVSGNATGIAIQARTNTAYVSGGNALTPIDLATLQAKPPVPVGVGATAVALASGGSVAWVCTNNGTVLSVNVTTGHRGKAVRVGGQPSAIVIPAAQRS
jgi:DNA-binding beta-propeller fold protein YncE